MLGPTETEKARQLRLLLGGASGQEWPGPIEHHESAGSTSDILRERARAGAPEWSVVLADVQTAGRGRHGRAWLSPAGNLCLSVLLRPTFESLSVLPLLAGLAVAEAAADWGVAAQLKWPNDVVAGGRKLGGILSEAASSGGRVECVVLGIGVNLLLDPAEAPPELRDTVTSVKHETGRVVSTVDAAGAVLRLLGVWYHALATGGPAGVIGAWRERSVPWWGRRVEVVSGEARLSGIARGIDESGALVLEGEDGAPIVVVSGEARVLRPSREA